MDNLIKVTNIYKNKKETLLSNFKLESKINIEISSLLVTVNDSEINIDKMNEIKETINNNFKITSPIRGRYRFMFTNIFTQFDNYNDKFLEFKKNIDALDTIYKFKSQMINGAYILTKLNIEDEGLIIKAQELERRLSKEYFYFNRYAFSSQIILAARLDLSVDEIVDKINKCYVLLKQNKFKYSSALSIVFILLFSENYQMDIKKIVRIHSKLKDEKYKFRNSYEVTSLALYCLIEEFDDIIIKNIKESFEYVNENIKFSFITNKTTKLMFSTIFSIASYNLEENIRLLSESFLLSYSTIAIQQQTDNQAAVLLF